MDHYIATLYNFNIIAIAVINLILLINHLAIAAFSYAACTGGYSFIKAGLSHRQHNAGIS